MAAKQEVSAPEEEEVGDFLLLTETLHDCFFIVGNISLAPTERIGAVKICLMNQSRVFRSMLHDSRLAETGDITVPDIQPPVFRLFLKHCYGGLESCRDVNSELTVQLCYAAEKYMVGSLKRKIADRLKPDHVLDLFPALHCCVNYNVTDLQQHVAEMVCEQTSKVFESEGFLEMDAACLEFIVKQEILNCSELDVWRAALRWAAHKASSEEGPALRQWLRRPLRHMRLAALGAEALCSAVLPADVLSPEEFRRVCTGHAAPAHAPHPDLCPLVEARPPYRNRWKWWETVNVTHDSPDKRWRESETSCACVRVGDRPIALESVTCLGSIEGDFRDRYGLAGACRVELTVARVTDPIGGACEEPVTVAFDGQAGRYVQFTVPTLVDGEPVALLADSLYRLKLSFAGPHPSWRDPGCSSAHVFAHGKFYCSYVYEDGIGRNASHIVKFQYSYKR